MQLATKFKILRIVLWLCTLATLSNFAITGYFFITKDPVPYYDGLTCDTCGAPNTAHQELYTISNAIFVLSAIVAIITTVILVILSAEHNHDLAHREARKRNRFAIIANIVSIILTVILQFVFTNTILHII